MQIESVVHRWKEDYNFKMTVKTAVNFIVTVVFAVYNIVLSAIYHSAWHIGLGVYYILLAMIRGAVAGVAIYTGKIDHERKCCFVRRTFLITSILFILLNVVLTVPTTMMIFFQRKVDIPMFVAIGMAAYTVCKIITSSINLKKVRGNSKILLKEISIINFVDVLVSILVLQNSLIVLAGGKDNYNMFILSSVVSAVVMTCAIGLSAYNMSNYRKFK